MIYYSEAEWTERGISREVHKLFVLLWSEQLSAGTYDGWQVRMMNVQSLLNEVVSVAELSSRFEPYRYNLGFIVDEAKEVARRDPIVRERFAHVYRTLESFPRGTKDVNLSEIKAKASLLRDHLQTYEQRLIHEVREMLSQTQGHDVRELDNAVMALGTHLSVSGYSLEYLDECRVILERPTEPDFVRRFDELMNRLDKGPRTYTSLFPISGASGMEQIPGLALRRASSLEETAVRAWRDQARGRRIGVDVFAEIRTTAMDPYVAAREGYAKISGVFAAARLYLPLVHLGVNGDSALVRYEDGTYRRIRHASQLDYVKNSTSARDRITRLLELLNRLRREEGEQLRTALEYHRLALVTGDPVAQIVNMWAAMEVLFMHGSGSIIERIAGYIPCTLVLNNVHKQLTSLAIYLKTLSHSNDALADLLVGGTGRVEPRALLTLLIDDDASRYERLMALCAENPLVRHRTASMRQKLRGKDISKRIKTYRDNIDWQLRRIYRARNEAMHHGRLPARSSPLVQHLHSYLATSIHRLIYCLSAHPEWSITDTFVHDRLLYDDYVRVLELLRKKESRGSAVVTSDVMAGIFLDPGQALASVSIPDGSDGST